LVVKQFWPTTICSRIWADHTAQAPGIIEFLYQVKSNQTKRIASGVAPGAKSASGLFESNFDLFAADHAGLNKLKAFIGQTVQMAAAQVNGGQVEQSRLRVAVLDSWFHITNDGGFPDAHFHGGCSWCGIYYLQVGDSGKRIENSAPNGSNRFYSPLRTGGSFKDYGNQYLDFNYVDVPLRDGMLVLFPSYLMHSGLPYRGEKDRIVISFNSQVTVA
jgi:uncharacterized protein (TIGR02466 family)